MTWLQRQRFAGDEAEQDRNPLVSDPERLRR